ncbi:hypothetical protein BKA93DRAFT_728235 [Sparassis latifolia]
MASEAAEIIDLTVTPPPVYADLEDEEIILVNEETTTNSNGKPKKPRRKKGRMTEPVEVGVGAKASMNGVPHVNITNGCDGKRTPAEKTLTKKSLLERMQDANSVNASTSGSGGVVNLEESERGTKRKKRKQKRSGSLLQDSEQYQGRGRRSRSPDRQKEDNRSSNSAIDDNNCASLFFVDVNHSDLPSSMKLNEQQPGSSGKTPEQEETPMLLLPAHVSVFGEGGVDPVEILPPSNPVSDDDDYIEYLDYDDDRKAPWMKRYFDQPEDEEKVAKPTKIVCKNCGAEGEHKTYQCPVLITCPNRYSSRAGVSQSECDRCGARTHNTNECPTLWRMYEYVGDSERQTILVARDAKKTLALGQGGEGYIASDEWCYNCGACGHLGDDCRGLPYAPDIPREPSAFGSYNTVSGPFYDTSSASNEKRPPRDWEVASAFADGFGFNAPMNVGKQGRQKERARMEMRAKEIEEEERQDDWFARPNGRRSGEGAENGQGQPKGYAGGKKIEIGLSSSNSRRDNRRDNRDGVDRPRLVYDDLPGPSRETDSIRLLGAATKQYDDRYGDRYSGSRRGRSRERDRGKHWDRRDDRRDERRGERGPRYRGGYAR